MAGPTNIVNLGSVSVSASIGISLFPDHGASYEEIFKKADEALYTVKNSGKNGFKIFE